MTDIKTITALKTDACRTDDFASSYRRCAAGILSEYADSTLTDIEKTAFEAAMVKKHENS